MFAAFAQRDRDIFLSEIDETQKKILGLEVLGFDAILLCIAGNGKSAKTYNRYITC